MIYDNVKLSDEHIEYKWVDILDLPKYNLKNTLAYVRKEIIYYVLHYEMF